MINKKSISILAVIMILALMLSACGSSNQEPTPDPNLIITQAVETAMVALTQTALAEPSPTFTEVPTLAPTATFTPTVLIETYTPGPTQPPVQQGPPLSSCDLAAFVDDITIPDGTKLAPGETFTKTWRVKNNGSCTWTPNYQLLYYGGEVMSAETAYALTDADIAPGENLDISIEMTAPATAGTYYMYWIMRNANGENFGVSEFGDSIYVQIEVSGSAASTTEAPAETATNTPEPTTE